MWSAALFVLASSTAPAGTQEPPPPVPTAQMASAPANPFQMAVPGSLAHLTMQPILPGRVGDGAGGERAVGGYWIASTEITWDMFDAFVLATDGPAVPSGVDAIARPSKPYISADRGFGREGFPALSIGLPAAQGFCDWLSAHTGQRWRLPDEFEWEHAALAGGPGPWHTPAADGAAPAGERGPTSVAWFKDNAQRRTRRVGSLAPNAFGLFDMHGNVAEWVTSADGKGRLCGGSYADTAADVRAVARKRPSAVWNASDPNLPKSRWWLADAPFAGFRVLCETEPAAPPATDP